MVFLHSIWLMILVALVGAQKNFEQHQVWKVWAFTREHAIILHDLEGKNFIDLWSHVTTLKDSPVLMSLDSKDARMVSDVLEASGIRYVLHNDNLQRMIDESYTPKPANERDPDNTFDYFVYHPLWDIEDYYRWLGFKYYRTVNQSDIGTAAEGGLQIKALEINLRRDEERPNVFIDCGIHGREWVTVSFCLYAIHMFTDKSHESTPRKILDKYRVHILPVYNPDGYMYTWTGDRLWRKNRNERKSESPCVGVDLNRNFDSHFGESGASSSPCAQIYTGPYPNSEPETQAVVNYLKSIGEIKAYFNVHSYSQFWMYPYGYTETPVKTVDELDKIAKVGTDAIKATHNEVYRRGSIYKLLTYPSSGGTIDYIYDTIGAQYAYGLELRDEGKYGFLLPESLIRPTVEEMFAGLAAAIDAM